MTKGVVINKPTKPKEDKQNKPNTRNKQRGFGIVELLFVATTIGAAVLVAASRGPKIPPAADD